MGEITDLDARRRPKLTAGRLVEIATELRELNDDLLGAKVLHGDSSTLCRNLFIAIEREAGALAVAELREQSNGRASA